MAADDLFDVTPIAPLTPEELGLPPAPNAPQAPVLGGTEDPRKRRIQSAVAALSAMLAGPGAGTGIAQGYLQAQQTRKAEQRQRDLDAQSIYRQQQTDFEQAQRTYQSEEARRSSEYARNITALRQVAAKVKSKEELEPYLAAFAQGMQRMGFRVTPNSLRTAVPFVEPKAEAKAQELLDRWLKNPANADLLKNHPEQAVKAVLPFDRDGDGVPEHITLEQLASLAQMPFAQDPEKGLMFSPKGTGAQQKAGVDDLYQELLTIARAEGKPVDAQDATGAKLRKDLMLQAQQEIENIQPPQRAPLPTPGQPGTLPPRTQSRVDAKSKGFDAQPVVKTTQKMAEAVTFANSLDPNTTNPADDQALIYAFAKAMDPDSVVREGEYATVQKYAQSWAETFGFNTARMFTNTAFLTPQARQNMKATIQKRYAAGKAQYDNVRKSYAQQINKITGQADGEEWLTDYGAAFPTEDPSDPAAAARAKLGAR